MDPEKHWRIGNAHYLRGTVLRRERWEAPSERWDHDHCSFCWAEFSESEDPEVQHEGYTTTEAHQHGAGYHWVCEQCFADLKDEMHWQLAAE
jgi:hypothetical protein